MKKHFGYIALLVLYLSALSLKAEDITTSLVSQYVYKYEALEKFNDENDRNGRSSQNQYIIELSPDWIEERPGPGLVILKDNYEDIAEMLREFNGSRKDNLRFYVVVSGVFQAYVKQDISILQLPERFENFDIAFKDLLDVKVRNSIFDVLWGNGVDKFRKGVSLALKKKGYTERALYFFSVLQLFTHDGNNTYYAIDNLKLTGELSKYSKQIRSKARQGWVTPDVIKKVDPPDVRVASAVANIINAIAIEYDAEGASSSGIVDCGKDVAAIANETWKGQGTVYNDTIKAFARLIDAPSGKQKFKSEYFIIDKPENFTNTAIRNAILPDVVFNSEILPDKIKLLAAQGKCDYKVYVVFKEVDFAIPDEQRAAFARDVQAQSSIGSQPNTILILVPYYSCVNNEVHYADYSVEGIQSDAGSYTSRSGYPMYLMPCVYSLDANMMLQMNSALRRQKSFRDGFNQAFKYIPKDYTLFVWSVLWNGDAIYKGAPEEYKRVTGYEDLVGVQILQDTRLDAIYKATHDRNCMAEGSDGETITPQDIDRVYACLAALNVDIDNILSKPADFKVLEGTSDLIQSQLTLDVSRQFVLAFASRKAMKIHTNISDNLFYGRHNPFKEPDLIMNLIDIASLAASPAGLDFIFDGLGAYYAFSIGENAQGMMYMVSLAIPLATGGMLREALVEGTALLVKGAKGSYKVISRKVYGLTFLLRHENEFSHLARSMLHPKSFNKLKAYSSELNFVEALEDGLVTEPKAAQAFNADHELVDEFHTFHTEGKGDVKAFMEAKGLSPADDITILDFNDLPGINVASLGKDEAVTTAVARIKPEQGYFDVVVHGSADRFWVLHNGKWEGITHRSLIGYLEKNKAFKEAQGIRLISCEAGTKELAQNFANNAGKKAKAVSGVKVGVDESGNIVSLSGKPGHWAEFEHGNWTGSFENPGNAGGEIRMANEGDNIVPLGIFDDLTSVKLDYRFDGDNVVKIYLDEGGTYLGSCTLHDDGLMTLDIDVMLGPNRERVADGEAVFNMMYTKLAEKNSNKPMKGIIGMWIDNPELNTNLVKLNKLIVEQVNKKMITLEEAALKTFTGRMAKEKNFNYVALYGPRNYDGTFKTAIVHFTNDPQIIKQLKAQQLEIAINTFKGGTSSDNFLINVMNDAQHYNSTDELAEVFQAIKPDPTKFIGASGKDYQTVFRNLITDNPSSYFDATKRLSYEVKIKDGKWFVNGNMLEDGQQYIFVMGKDGTLYAGKDIRGQIHHSYFLEGQNVALAGAVKFENGQRIITIINDSGHYEPSGSALWIGVLDFLREMAYRGTDIKSITYLKLY